MPIVKVLVQMIGKSGDPKDRFVNTHHFNAAGADLLGDEVPAIFTALKNFYGQDTEQVTNQQAAGQRNILDYIGDHLQSGQVHQMKFYDLSEPAPRQPIFTGTFTKNDNAAAKLPAEVAVVLSLKGDVPQGQNVQRGRGRIYLGPLNVRAMTEDANDARVTVAFRQVIAKAAVRLNDEVAGNATWVIHSAGAREVDPNNNNKRTGPLLPAINVNVDGGYVDDAFDTQRRRGVVNTSRNLWS